MAWKDWSYWLKGGVVGFGIGLIIILPFIIIFIAGDFIPDLDDNSFIGAFFLLV